MHQNICYAQPQRRRSSFCQEAVWGKKLPVLFWLSSTYATVSINCEFIHPRLRKLLSRNRCADVRGDWCVLQAWDHAVSVDTGRVNSWISQQIYVVVAHLVPCDGQATCQHVPLTRLTPTPQRTPSLLVMNSDSCGIVRVKHLPIFVLTYSNLAFYCIWYRIQNFLSRTLFSSFQIQPLFSIRLVFYLFSKPLWSVMALPKGHLNPQGRQTDIAECGQSHG